MGNPKTKSGSKVCLNCDGDLPTLHGNRKFCSERCRRRYHNYDDHPKDNACLDCGTAIRRAQKRCFQCQRAAQIADGNRKLSYLAHLWAQGMSVRDMAEAVGSTPNAVGVRIANARRAGIKAFPHRYNVKSGRKFKGPKPIEFPSKKTVRGRTRQAIVDGLLTRPDACDECGRECFVDAHHLSYDKPDSHLDVEWLCPSCHVAQHHQQKEAA
jgi:hypothetical protein